MPGDFIKMGRLVLFLSLGFCLLAVLFTFAPIRTKLVDLMPDIIKQTVQETINTLSLKKSTNLFTREELAQYKGENGGKVYVAVLGNVYDVTRGKKHYGPGGGYSFFSGRDASRAFVTGEFQEEGLTDDVTGLTSTDILALEDWSKFYAREYTYVGKLIGTYYTADGIPTKAFHLYQENLEKAQNEKQAQDDMRKIFPPCNSEWSEGGQTRVWCTTKSGGIERDWIGVPRQYFNPKEHTSVAQCVCVRTSGPPSNAFNSHSNKNNGDLDNPNLRPYPECISNSDSCILKKS